MTKIYITSDHHFYHNNIIKYCNRPFENYKQMNEFMITQWNKVVKKNDIVIHLGDFAYRGKSGEIRKQLNGTIILLRGNHDFGISNNDFIIVEGNLIIGNLILSHKPLEKDLIPKAMINIHGHIHDKKSYNGINISVERTNYKPIELDKIK